MAMNLLTVLLTACLLHNVAALPALTDRVLYQCNFEVDLCGMTLEPASSQFTWTRFQGSTPSLTTGPDFDHTYMNETGYYIYTEATGFNPGEIAKLALPTLTNSSSPKGAVCLTFWYHMYGQHIGTLNVTQGTEILWSLSHNQSYAWYQQNVTIKTPSAGQLRFVGVRGGDDMGQPYGDIAIDDVAIFDGQCGEDETTTVEQTTVTTTTAPPSTITSTTTAPSTATTTVQTSTAYATSTVAITQQATSNATSAVASTQQATANATSTVATTQEATFNATTTAARTTKETTTHSNETATVAPVNLINSTTASTSGTTSSSQNSSSAVSLASATSSSLQTTAMSSSQTSSKMNTTISAAQNRTETTTRVTSGTTARKDSTGTQQGGNGLSSTPIADAQAGTDQNPGTLWNLTAPSMILILCLLCATILILTLVIIALACCLCVTKRKYNVERSANIYQSSSTLDGVGVSTVEGHRGKEGPAAFDRVSVEY